MADGAHLKYICFFIRVDIVGNYFSYFGRVLHRVEHLVFSKLSFSTAQCMEIGGKRCARAYTKFLFLSSDCSLIRIDYFLMRYVG